MLRGYKSTIAVEICPRQKLREMCKVSQLKQAGANEELKSRLVVKALSLIDQDSNDAAGIFWVYI